MIINYEELLKEFRASSGPELIVMLNRANVKYLYGKKNRPFTTVTALNVAMGIKLPDKQHDDSFLTQHDSVEFL